MSDWQTKLPTTIPSNTKILKQNKNYIIIGKRYIIITVIIWLIRKKNNTAKQRLLPGKDAMPSYLQISKTNQTLIIHSFLLKILTELDTTNNKHQLQTSFIPDSKVHLLLL